MASTTHIAPVSAPFYFATGAAAPLPNGSISVDYLDPNGRIMAKSDGGGLAAIQFWGLTEDVDGPRSVLYLTLAEPTPGNPLCAFSSPLIVGGEVSAPYFIASGPIPNPVASLPESSLAFNYSEPVAYLWAKSSGPGLAAIQLRGISSNADGNRELVYLECAETTPGNPLCAINSPLIVNGGLQADSAEFASCLVDNSPVRTFANTGDSGGGMEWPPAGIGVSTGTAWSDESIDPDNVPLLNQSNSFVGTQSITNGVSGASEVGIFMYPDAPPSTVTAIQGVGINWNGLLFGGVEFYDIVPSSLTQAEGGFAWYRVSAGQPLSSATRLMLIDGSGNVTTEGNINVGGALATGASVYIAQGNIPLGDYAAYHVGTSNSPGNIVAFGFLNEGDNNAASRGLIWVPGYAVGASFDRDGNWTFAGTVNAPHLKVQTAGAGAIHVGTSQSASYFDAYGVDAATNGIFYFRSARSDQSNLVTAMAVDGIGNLSVAGNIAYVVGGPSATDYNQLTTSGVYCMNTPTNAPPSSDTRTLIVQVYHWPGLDTPSPNCVFQIAYNFNHTGEIWYRFLSWGGWTTWIRFSMVGASLERQDEDIWTDEDYIYAKVKGRTLRAKLEPVDPKPLVKTKGKTL